MEGGVIPPTTAPFSHCSLALASSFTFTATSASSTPMVDAGGKMYARWNQTQRVQPDMHKCAVRNVGLCLNTWIIAEGFWNVF